MKSFKKSSLFILSALFITSAGFASECPHATEEVKEVVENVAGDPAEIAEESEDATSDVLSCKKCGKGNHYADCGCGGKKKKNKLELA